MRHSLDAAGFQAELDGQRAAGAFTRALTGYQVGRDVYHGAFWTR